MLSPKTLDPNRDATVRGDQAIRGIYDYAHSVFPLSQWQHSVGIFETSHKVIQNFPSPPVADNVHGRKRAFVHWHWRVDWKANTTGVVSTGTYDDVFEKRGNEWKLLAKVSRDDPNWPLYMFAPYVANQKNSFQSSCGDTSL